MQLSWTSQLEAIAQDEVAGGIETNKRVMEYCKTHGLKLIPVLQQVRIRITDLLDEKYKGVPQVEFADTFGAEPSPEPEVIDLSYLCDCCGLDTRLGHKVWCSR